MQIIVVIVAGQMYGIDISYIRDISHVPALIALPTLNGNKPEGICNFRGKVISVYDLPQLLHIGRTGQERKLLVAELPNLMVGLIVSDVEEVIHINEDLIQNIALTEVVTGAIPVDDNLVSILDIEKLF